MWLDKQGLLYVYNRTKLLSTHCIGQLCIAREVLQRYMCTFDHVG